MSDFDDAMRLSEEIGDLRGQVKVLELLRDTQAKSIQQLHVDKLALTTRAVAAETELAAANKSLEQIERLKL